MKFYRFQHKETGIGPFNSDGYSVAFASGFIEHRTLWEQPRRFVQKTHSRFRADGRLMCKFAWRNFEHILMYAHDKAITEMIRRDFVVVEVCTKKEFMIFPDGQVVYNPDHADEVVIDWDVFKERRKKLLDSQT